MRRTILVFLAVGCSISVAFPATSAEPTVELVSVDSDERAGDSWSSGWSMSADGRYITFHTYTKDWGEKFWFQTLLRDLTAGTTKVISRNSKGAIANEPVAGAKLSSNGRYLVFCTTATNMPGPDTDPPQQLWPPNGDAGLDPFVRDLKKGVTKRVAVSINGKEANQPTCGYSVSNKGDVVFSSYATNLNRRDHDNESIEEDVFLYRWGADKVRRISLSHSGGEPDGDSNGAAISDDGSTIFFESSARNLVKGAPEHDTYYQLYLYSVEGRRMERIERWPYLENGGHCRASGQLSTFSTDARYIGLHCHEDDPSPENGAVDSYDDYFLWDTRTDTFETMMRASGATYSSETRYALSPNGRNVAVCTDVKVLPEDTDNVEDIYVRDLDAKRTVLLTQTSDGSTLTDMWCSVQMTTDAELFGFTTEQGLDPRDVDEDTDIYTLTPRS